HDHRVLRVLLHAPAPCHRCPLRDTPCERGPGGVNPPDDTRSTSFGQLGAMSPADRLGIWLSGRRIRKEVGDFGDKAIGDFGCGYEAKFTRTVLGDVASATLIDVA